MVNLTGEQVKAETLFFILPNINYQNNYLDYVKLYLSDR